MKEFGFDLFVEHPHKYLIQFLAILGLDSKYIPLARPLYSLIDLGQQGARAEGMELPQRLAAAATLPALPARGDCVRMHTHGGTHVPDCHARVTYAVVGDL